MDTETTVQEIREALLRDMNRRKEELDTRDGAGILTFVLELAQQGTAVWGETPPLQQWKIPFELGNLVRRGFENDLRMFLDRKDVVYRLRSYPGWFVTGYNLRITITSWNDLRCVIAVMRFMQKWGED